MRTIGVPTPLARELRVVHAGTRFTIEPEPSPYARYAERGFGGREFLVRLSGGDEIVTRNLWIGEPTEERDTCTIYCAENMSLLEVPRVLLETRDEHYTLQVVRESRNAVKALVMRNRDKKIVRRIFEGLDTDHAETWALELIARDRNRSGVAA
ncbi:MAG: hypothetical protein KIS66_13645 [Fimbriimonadaceae bacterium]|nr:hypothetical protein [Fimbriimonadaceae bacterium]